jgi:chromate reductase, NAD(P)H dehydrogenase (quinone)
MYTIISGTNRIGSNTLKVAKQYQLILKEKGIEAGLLSLENVNVLTRDADFIQIENDILIPTNRFIFITPEYNGSFPGVLKMLFDTSKSHTIWWHKKALITGLSTGRAGNLRGNDHLSSVLNYLKITVHPNQLPISIIDKLLDENGHFADQNTLKVIHQQLDDFIVWSEGHKKVTG